MGSYACNKHFHDLHHDSLCYLNGFDQVLSTGEAKAHFPAPHMHPLEEPNLNLNRESIQILKIAMQNTKSTFEFNKYLQVECYK